MRVNFRRENAGRDARSQVRIPRRTVLAIVPRNAKLRNADSRPNSPEAPVGTL